MLKSRRRYAAWLSGLGLFAVATLATADGKLEVGNWKEIVPEPHWTKIVEETTKTITEYTKSPSSFNMNARKTEVEAYGLITYAEIARNAGGDNAAKATTLRDLAIELAAAAHKKDAAKSKELAAKIADMKSLAAGDKAKAVDLAKVVEIDPLMKNVENTNKEVQKYKRMTSAAFGPKTEEIQHFMHKMAAHSVAITAHAPTADLPKGKTTADWLKSAEEMRVSSLAGAAAAKKKNLADLKTAVNRMDASCTKCHDDFKVESK